MENNENGWFASSNNEIATLPFFGKWDPNRGPTKQIHQTETHKMEVGCHLIPIHNQGFHVLTTAQKAINKPNHTLYSDKAQIHLISHVQSLINSTNSKTEVEKVLATTFLNIRCSGAFLNALRWDMQRVGLGRVRGVGVLLIRMSPHARKRIG